MHSDGHAPRGASMNLAVRKAAAADAEAACAVLRRAITECCVADHQNDPDVLSAWLRNKTPEQVCAWLVDVNNHALVATASGRVVGLGLLAANDEIGLCYVLPEALYRGVGKALLAALESHAIQRGSKTLRLRSTLTARAFYLRHGYVPDGEPHTVFGIAAFPLLKRLDGALGQDEHR